MEGGPAHPLSWPHCTPADLVGNLLEEGSIFFPQSIRPLITLTLGSVCVCKGGCVYGCACTKVHHRPNPCPPILPATPNSALSTSRGPEPLPWRLQGAPRPPHPHPVPCRPQAGPAPQQPGGWVGRPLPQRPGQSSLGWGAAHIVYVVHPLARCCPCPCEWSPGPASSPAHPSSCCSHSARGTDLRA